MVELLREKGHISLADVFMNLGYLDHGDYEKWRMRRVSDLERVIKVNLSKINFIIRVVRKNAITLGLRPSRTEYRSWGKGKKTTLLFSKSGKQAIEATYATHFIPGKPKTQNRVVEATSASAAASALKRSRQEDKAVVYEEA